MDMHTGRNRRCFFHENQDPFIDCVYNHNAGAHDADLSGIQCAEQLSDARIQRIPWPYGAC